MKFSSVLVHGIRGIACFSSRKVVNAWNPAALTVVAAGNDFGTADALARVPTLSERWLGSGQDLKTQERMATMSIDKKSLISNRAAVKKAMIASQSAEAPEATGDPKSLKSTTLAAHSMKKTKASPKFSFTAFKAK
jgi:hypothetical protein